LATVHERHRETETDRSVIIAAVVEPVGLKAN